MTKLDFLQEVYTDYCTKHGLEHVSTCEQSGLTAEQWNWIENFDKLWDHAVNQD